MKFALFGPMSFCESNYTKYTLSGSHSTALDRHHCLHVHLCACDVEMYREIEKIYAQSIVRRWSQHDMERSDIPIFEILIMQKYQNYFIRAYDFGSTTSSFSLNFQKEFLIFHHEFLGARLQKIQHAARENFFG